MQELFARHGAGAALSAKAVFKPTKDFHTARHTLFSAEQNLAIDKVVPLSASVKTKLGRGGSYEDWSGSDGAPHFDNHFVSMSASSVIDRGLAM